MNNICNIIKKQLSNIPEYEEADELTVMPSYAKFCSALQFVACIPNGADGKSSR